MKRLLIIFAKNPELGKVKTRLAASIGDELALEVYNTTLEHVREVTLPLQADKRLYYSDFIDHQDNWQPSVYNKYLQHGEELGRRMHNAFAESFAAGYESICIIGSDCHELTTEVLEEAFTKLERYDVVLGPAEDGGYYLLGMKRLYSSFFRHKPWSTPYIFSETIADTTRMHLSLHLLPILNDIDEEKDLFVYKR